MTRDFGVRPDTLVAAIGPSIGACCYDVGEELLAAFAEAGHSSVTWPNGSSETRPAACGSISGKPTPTCSSAPGAAGPVHVAGLCTKTHLDVLESFRVDGAKAGRMAAIIVAQGQGPGTRD